MRKEQDNKKNYKGRSYRLVFCGSNKGNLPNLVGEDHSLSQGREETKEGLRTQKRTVLERRFAAKACVMKPDGKKSRTMLERFSNQRTKKPSGPGTMQKFGDLQRFHQKST